MGEEVGEEGGITDIVGILAIRSGLVHSTSVAW